MSTLQQTEPVVVPAGSGRFIDLGDHRSYTKVSSRDNGGAFLLLEIEVDPQGGTTSHIHHREDETFYIQDGCFTFHVGEQTIEAGPGDILFAPRHISHAWRCLSAEGGKVLVLITPGDNFESLANDLDRLGLLGTTPSDADSMAKLIAVMERHGFEMLPPGELHHSHSAKRERNANQCRFNDPVVAGIYSECQETR